MWSNYFRINAGAHCIWKHAVLAYTLKMFSTFIIQLRRDTVPKLLTSSAASEALIGEEPPTLCTKDTFCFGATTYSMFSSRTERSSIHDLDDRLHSVLVQSRKWELKACRSGIYGSETAILLPIRKLKKHVITTINCSQRQDDYHVGNE